MTFWIAKDISSSNPVSKFFHHVPEGRGDPANRGCQKLIFDLGNGFLAKSKVQLGDVIISH